jgi:hypothetical protein
MLLMSSNAWSFEWQIKALESHYPDCGDGRKALLVVDKDINIEYNHAYVCLPEEQLAVIMKNLCISQETSLPGITFNEKLAMRSEPAKELVGNLIEYHAAAKQVEERMKK